MMQRLQDVGRFMVGLSLGLFVLAFVFGVAGNVAGCVATLLLGFILGGWAARMLDKAEDREQEERE